MSINRTIVSGRVGRDPEKRLTTSGKEVVSFSVAVDDNYDKDKTHWFNVTAWGKTAEFVGNYVTKGRLVGIDGRLSQRKWTTNEGQPRDATEIVADNIVLLDRPRDADPVKPVAAQDTDDPFADD